MTRTATPVILLLTTSAFIGLEGSSLPHPPAHQGILPPWVKPTTGAILKGDTRLAISDNCFTAQLVEPFMKLMAGLFICSYIPMFVIAFSFFSSVYKSCFTAGHLKIPPRPLARMSRAWLLKPTTRRRPSPSLLPSPWPRRSSPCSRRWRRLSSWSPRPPSCHCLPLSSTSQSPATTTVKIVLFAVVHALALALLSSAHLLVLIGGVIRHANEFYRWRHGHGKVTIQLLHWGGSRQSVKQEPLWLAPPNRLGGRTSHCVL